MSQETFKTRLKIIITAWVEFWGGIFGEISSGLTDPNDLESDSVKITSFKNAHRPSTQIQSVSLHD